MPVPSKARSGEGAASGVRPWQDFFPTSGVSKKVVLTIILRHLTFVAMRDQFRDGKVIVDNAIGFWIHRVYQASRNEMFRAFRAMGVEVTPEQWAMLIRLWEADGRTQAELSEATFRDAPTMSRILTGMEARGLIERRVDRDDARVRRVHLTRSGRALQARLVPVVQRIVEQMVEGVDERDLRTTRRSLRRMFANLEP
jgi:DNA-binding MarR family transcriptional regulator